MRKAIASLLAVIALLATGCTVPEENNSEQDVTFGNSNPDYNEDPEKNNSPLTVGQENAVAAAEMYLDTQAFSKEGLQEQLRFEGYTPAQAEFAVKYIKPDWNAQAARAAQQYLDTMPMSKSGLIEQLMFEGYTRAQAQYGADQVL